MSEDRTSSSTKDGKPRSWLERLGQVLQGELKDRQQLLTVLRDARENNVIDSDAMGMIEGVLEVAEMQVRDIMIPRSQMVVVDRDSKPEEILPVLLKSGHSRFPVIGENKDEVIGILLAKDMLSFFATGEGESRKLNLKEVLRPAVFIPESKRLNVLLNEFRSNRNHIAIVVDEYGGVAGLVTIEDVLEQIVGDIEDEHDIDDDMYILEHNDGHCTVKAITPIEDFNEHFSSDFSDEEFDTIGGLVLNALGHMPKRGEQVALDRFKFKVLRADSRRVYLLQCTPITEPVQTEAASNETSE